MQPNQQTPPEQELNQGQPPQPLGTPVAQPPTPPPTKPKKQRPLLTTLLLCLGATVLIVAVVLAIIIATKPDALDQLAEPGLNRHSENVARQNDVQSIAGGFSEYMNNTRGIMPQTVAKADSSTDATKKLAICGTDCSAAATAEVSLGKYNPSAGAITFKPYAADLTVPDVNTVYIVVGAKCNATKSGLGDQITTRSAAFAATFLYALDEQAGPRQQCIEL